MSLYAPLCASFLYKAVVGDYPTDIKKYLEGKNFLPMNQALRFSLHHSDKKLLYVIIQ